MQCNGVLFCGTFCISGVDLLVCVWSVLSFQKEPAIISRRKVETFHTSGDSLDWGVLGSKQRQPHAHTFPVSRPVPPLFDCFLSDAEKSFSESQCVAAVAAIRSVFDRSTRCMFLSVKAKKVPNVHFVSSDSVNGTDVKDSNPSTYFSKVLPLPRLIPSVVSLTQAQLRCIYVVTPILSTSCLTHLVRVDQFVLNSKVSLLAKLAPTLCHDYHTTSVPSPHDTTVVFCCFFNTHSFTKLEHCTTWIDILSKSFYVDEMTEMQIIKHEVNVNEDFVVTTLGIISVIPQKGERNREDQIGKSCLFECYDREVFDLISNVMVMCVVYAPLVPVI